MRFLAFFYGAALGLGFEAVQSQTIEEVAIPTSIDIPTYRELLDKSFPEIDRELKTIDGLKKYLKELESFRLTQLESLNEKILLICEGLVAAERQGNKGFAAGDISKNEKGRLDNLISREREKCIVPKKDDSPYWKLYDDWLQFYKDQAKDTSKELASCNADDACRGREI